MVASSSFLELQKLSNKKSQLTKNQVVLSPIDDLSEKTEIEEIEDTSSYARIDNTNSMYQVGLGNLTLFLFDNNPKSLQNKLSKELASFSIDKKEDCGMNFIFSISLLVMLGCFIAPLAIPGLSEQSQSLRKSDIVISH
ncbi:hypothetical protein F7734_54260 [Scytonema sp. UIC 10036]|uniref:hypothetical protein n=1 Tax=Scytonema sp. UIC 10036 TaxID=2304196 RepID=UPI0012DA5CA8|nr:hypothetical protein [Scytonema sp. UIC 10036]MUH00768.1 hypothetical protein [Scytonema sp. UIC 10036]